ncbi:MAG: hypothetical protein RLY87_1037 [Chloroflexota bacterium]|jgi:hypothetical protein
MKKFHVILAIVSVLGFGLVPAHAAPEHQLSPAAPTEAQLPCTIRGSVRNDVLRGTAGNDVICGLAGADVIYGNGGNDVIYGGAGNDTIDGGNGNDRIDGDGGNDRMTGGMGDDVLGGDTGNDVINAGAGDDVLQGDSGSDQLNAGVGDDSLSGGSERDILQPGSGDNQCAVDTADVTVGPCRRDTVVPVFAPMVLERAVTAGETLTIEYELTDESPIAMSWGFLGGSSGWVTEWCGFPVMATAVNQTTAVDSGQISSRFRLSCPVPATAPNGEYLLDINAIDVFGNYATAQRIILTVQNGSTDVTAPTVSEVAFSTDSVSLEEPFTVTLRLDDETEIAGSYVYLAHEGYRFADNTGRGYMVYNTPELTPIAVSSGAAQQHTQRIEFVPTAPAGVYTVWVSVRDTLGNRSFIQTSTTIELR